MLKLTKKADYGLIALKHLANYPGGSSASSISERYGIPLPILAKVLQKLVREGLLRSEHGATGGYQLARDARKITTLDVISAIDGPIILTACFHDDADCSHSDRCTVRDPLRKLHDGILRLLSGISIWDMSQDDKPADCGPPAPPPGDTMIRLQVLPH